MIRLNTSIRSRTLQETLAEARVYADRFGVSQVRDITSLDRVGLPVFCSHRPQAGSQAMGLHSGKGVHPDEARVGAYMEAIEVSLAMQGAVGMEVVNAVPEEIYEGKMRAAAILDFCPLKGKQIALDLAIPAVQAKDLATQCTFLVPAERVFVPFTSQNPAAHLFLPSSNGLASGNTALEAQAHGILEVIERDIHSFHSIHGKAHFVHPDSFPSNAGYMAEKIATAGLHLFVRFVPNAFGIPTFLAYLHEADNPALPQLMFGMGCHPDKSIALARAISEAVQSRLVTIYRKVLAEQEGAQLAPEVRLAPTAYQKAAEVVAESKNAISFDQIPSLGLPSSTPGAFLEGLLNLLREKGFPHVLHVPFTTPEEPLQVCRIIIPRMEHYKPSAPHIGQRLSTFANQHLSASKVDSLEAEG